VIKDLSWIMQELEKGRSGLLDSISMPVSRYMIMIKTQ